jgi:plastocyanin
MEPCTHNHVAGKHLRRVLMAVTGLTLLLIPLALTDHTDAAGTASVTMNGGLTPKVITVQVGTTVTWQFADAGKHRMRSLSGPTQFDSGGLPAGGSWSFTFSALGTVNYGDDENKNIDAYMGSVVVVNTVPTTTPGTTPGTTVPGGTTPPTPPALPQTVAVRIANRAFAPTSLSIAVGDTVVWTNNDKEAHTVTERNLSFDSGSFGVGATFRRTFTAPGTYSYFCDIHPSMVGVVAVSAPTTGGTLPPPPTLPPTPPTPSTVTGGGAGGGSGGGAGGGAGSGIGGGAGGGSTGAPSVTIADFSFAPATLTVAQGTTVTWTNSGLARHTVAANDGTFHSPDVRAGQTYTRTFPTPGTYTYICDIHPDMKGTIAVTGAGGTPPPPAPPTTALPPVTANGDVRIADFNFAPRTITITAGESLTFVNTGAARHSATARDGSFDTGLLPRGQSATRTFGTPGTYLYFCTLHSQMTGTILVEGTDGSAPPPPKEVVAAVAKDGDVQMADFSFSPKQLTVVAGSSIGFTNGGVAPHTATSKDGSWDTGIVRSGTTTRVTFDTPGTFTYYCTIHPQMVGTLLVTGADGAAPPPEAAASTPVTPSKVDVKVLADTFEPADARVAQGGVVTWTVDSLSPHIIEADKGAFTSDLVHHSEVFSFTFDTPGTYQYHDGLTGEMVGSVTVVAAPGSAGELGASADGKKATVNIVDLDFDPREVTVVEGAEVTWTNTGQAPHTVTAKDQAWTSELLQNGDTFSHTFDQTGRFEYLCNLHPNMVGAVIVTDATGVAPVAQVPQPAAALVNPGSGGRGGTPMLLLVLGGMAVGLATFVMGRRSASHGAARV